MAKFKIVQILLGHDYKNFDISFINGLAAVRQAMLDSELPYYYSAGHTWSNI
jgi:hypothetical protein